MAVGTSGRRASPQTPNLVLSPSLNYQILPNAYWQVVVELAAARRLNQHETFGKVLLRTHPSRLSRPVKHLISQEGPDLK